MLKSHSISKAITPILLIEVVFITLYLVCLIPAFRSPLLGGIAVVGLVLCYWLLYPAAVLRERKHMTSNDLICFMISFASLGMILSFPVSKFLIRFLDRTNGDAIHSLLNWGSVLSTIGYVLVFLTLFYNLYIWHRVNGKRLIATRFALTLWPRQLFFIGKIIFFGIPL